jgi:xylobiose transport system permease protein
VTAAQTTGPVGGHRAGPRTAGAHRPTGHRRKPTAAARRRRPNFVVGTAAIFWLIVVGLPLYVMLSTSVRGESSYLADGPLSLPREFTLQNFVTVFEAGFHRYLFNSLIVAGSSILLVLAVAVPAAFAIVRSRSRLVRLGFILFLLGLAIPAQAVIIPVFLVIAQMGLYDTLIGVILPTAAFTLPISVLVLTSSLRDVPKDLYEAMAIDGASTWKVFVSLVLPMARPGMVTVIIFVGLSAWNNFIFPLVLTQSPELRVLPFALWQFQDQYTTDVPGLMAAVVLTLLPIFALYLFGRRQLLSGLAAGGMSK